MDIKTFEYFVEKGYDESVSDNDVAAYGFWKSAWKEFLRIVDEEGIKSLSEFDNKYKLSEFVSNFVQDYEMALENAGVKHKIYYEDRSCLVEEFLDRFGDSCDEVTKQNMQIALAESIFIMGDRDKSEAMFRQWVTDTPDKVWYFIRWADCWWFYTEKSVAEWKKVEEIYKEGLNHADSFTREDIYIRLHDLYEKIGLDE